MKCNVFPFTTLLLAMPLLAALAQGCAKEQAEPIIPPLELAVDYPAIPFTVQANGSPGQFQLQLDLDPAVLGQVLAAHGQTLGQVMDFRFTTAKLHLAAPANGNYNALGSVTVQVASGDGQPVTVANLSPVPDDSHTLILNLAGVNVADLIRGGSTYINIKFHLDGMLPDVSNHQLLLSAKATMQI